jgi:leader peptidase (prepilin peptidase) / N-methyltransferase
VAAGPHIRRGAKQGSQFRVSVMSIPSEVAVRSAKFGSDGWLWPAGSVFAYAVPAFVAWHNGLPAPSVVLLSSILALGLIILSEIDRKSFRLPDRITLPLLLAGLLAAMVIGDDVVWRLFSAGIGFAVIVLADQAYRAWRGVSGIGLGDAKLFAAAGAWLGAAALPTVLLWSCALALLVLLLVRLSGRPVTAQTAIPFGSFLAFGTWLVWCLGPLH